MSKNRSALSDSNQPEGNPDLDRYERLVQAGEKQISIIGEAHKTHLDRLDLTFKHGTWIIGGIAAIVGAVLAFFGWTEWAGFQESKKILMQHATNTVAEITRTYELQVQASVSNFNTVAEIARTSESRLQASESNFNARLAELEKKFDDLYKKAFDQAAQFKNLTMPEIIKNEEQIYESFLKTEDSRKKADQAAKIAWIYVDNPLHFNFEKALYYAQQLKDLARQLAIENPEEYTQLVGSALELEARIYVMNHDPNKAKECFEAALAKYQTVTTGRWVQTVKGWVENVKGELKKLEK